VIKLNDHALRINELHTSDPRNPATNPFTQNAQSMPATAQVTVAEPNRFGLFAALKWIWASPTPPPQD
jgi:hypothetical protein